MMVNLMHHHFGVGLGGKFVAFLNLKGTQHIMVLDDAVMHHGHGLAADVGMGVGPGGFTVGGPASMGDAAAAAQLLVLDQLLHLPDLAGGPRPLQAIILIQHHHAGGIITAILQALESLDQNRNYVTLRHRTHDTAHKTTSTRNLPGITA